MSPQYPYAKYPTFSSGEPIIFIVGPSNSPRRFDIHQLLLGTGSHIFNVSECKPRIITREICEIRLPNTDPDVFEVMCHWLYTKDVLLPTKAEQLADLMELWVVYAELGLHLKMNAIMRSGMALMQPKDFICPVSTVEWVYAHTNPKSKLREYVIAIFCQRGPKLTPELLADKDPAIFEDAKALFGVLQKVSQNNPRITADRLGFTHPLPDFLVWGDKAQDLPDEHFFVVEADEWQEGGDVLKQLRKMVKE